MAFHPQTGVFAKANHALPSCMKKAGIAPAIIGKALFMATMAAPMAQRPAHVPAASVVDFDMYEGPVKGQAHAPDVHREWVAFQEAHPPSASHYY